jgi:hypothetical protein
MKECHIVKYIMAVAEDGMDPTCEIEFLVHCFITWAVFQDV